MSNLGATRGEQIRVNRRAEMEAFDALPRSLRDVINHLPIPYSAIQVRTLMLRIPPDYVATMLVQDAGRRSRAADRKVMA